MTDDGRCERGYVMNGWHCPVHDPPPVPDLVCPACEGWGASDEIGTCPVCYGTGVRPPHPEALGPA